MWERRRRKCREHVRLDVFVTQPCRVKILKVERFYQDRKAEKKLLYTEQLLNKCFIKHLIVLLTVELLV